MINFFAFVKFYLPLFGGLAMNLKQRKIKFHPRIKLDHK